MVLVKELNKFQVDAVPKYAARFTEIGLSTGTLKDMDRPRLERALATLYQERGMDPPMHIIYLKNPLEGAIASMFLADADESLADEPTELVDAVIKDYLNSGLWKKKNVYQHLWSCGYGLHDSNWIGDYLFLLAECGFRSCKKILPLYDIAMTCGWWWPFERVVVVTPKPSHISLDSLNRPHNPNGPAISYEGDLFVYALKGVRCDRENIKENALV